MQEIYIEFTRLVHFGCELISAHTAFFHSFIANGIHNCGPTDGSARTGAAAVAALQNVS